MILFQYSSLTLYWERIISYLGTNWFVPLHTNSSMRTTGATHTLPAPTAGWPNHTRLRSSSTSSGAPVQAEAWGAVPHLLRQPTNQQLCEENPHPTSSSEWSLPEESREGSPRSCLNWNALVAHDRLWVGGGDIKADLVLCGGISTKWQESIRFHLYFCLLDCVTLFSWSSQTNKNSSWFYFLLLDLTILAFICD